jgi:hypothetical protein
MLDHSFSNEVASVVKCGSECEEAEAEVALQQAENHQESSNVLDRTEEQLDILVQVICRLQVVNPLEK